MADDGLGAARAAEETTAAGDVEDHVSAAEEAAPAAAAAVEMIGAMAGTNSNADTSTPTRRSAPQVPASIHAASASSHQSMLRQQAHSPVGSGLSSTSFAQRSSPAAVLAQAVVNPRYSPQDTSSAASLLQQQPQAPVQQLQQQQQLAFNLNLPPVNNSSNQSNNINVNNGYVPRPQHNNRHHNPHLNPHHPANQPHPPFMVPPEQAMETDTNAANDHDIPVDSSTSPTFSSFQQGASSGWSVVETSQGGAGGAPPSARSLHAAALLNGIMYVFGGYDGSQRVNTFHAFSFAEKRWSPVLPSANSAGPPTPRDRHVAVAFGNSFYVHGGFDGQSRVSDFWAFDFSSMTWRQVVAVQGRPPSPRHSHAAVVHGHSLYIFGGYDGSYKSDLNEFDFRASRWSVVPAAGRRPRARYRATCVTYKNSMILYGGHDGTRHLSDAHVFDFDTRTWSTLVTEGTPPIPRDSHVSVVHGNSMYIFGGSSGSAMNDLHELQLPMHASSPAKWRPVKISGVDQPRHRFCHVAVSYNESMFVFGGYDGSERLNDFIRFDFAVYDLSFEVPPSTIIQDFRDLINDETLSDVTFIVENQPVYAHKLMLMRCSYFRALFLGEMRESRLSSIRIEQVTHHIFLAILEYLYTDHVRIPFDCAMELFEAADLFCIPRLKTMCEKRMLQSITVENAAAIFHAADMHSAVALRQKAKKYILSHFEEICKTGCFEEMGRSNIELVFELLQSR